RIGICACRLPGPLPIRATSRQLAGFADQSATAKEHYYALTIPQARHLSSPNEKAPKNLLAPALGTPPPPGRGGGGGGGEARLSRNRRIPPPRICKRV